MTQWLSINEVKRLVKMGFYQLETGAHSSDQLIYDRQSRKYVGHIESGQYQQSLEYQVPQYIVKYLQEFDNDWTEEGKGW
jgi:hypothetical protein